LLQRDRRVWLGNRPAAVPAHGTGFTALDRQLPGGGWPVGALTELYPSAQGIGEFTLLLPAIARLTQAGRRVALIAPPYIPYSQALDWHGVRLDQLVLLQPERASDALWAMEQTLSSGTVALAIAWPRRPGERELRRLQLAAETGEACAPLYRPAREAEHASPAALRLKLAASAGVIGKELRSPALVHGAADGGLWLDIFKCRGGQPATVRIPSMHEGVRTAHATPEFLSPIAAATRLRCAAAA
jgi:cell division inhibitor SulA/protein ImuA